MFENKELLFASSDIIQIKQTKKWQKGQCPLFFVAWIQIQRDAYSSAELIGVIRQ